MIQFEARVRFNWGYHDAQFAAGTKAPDGAIRNREWATNHFDKAFGMGFISGMNDKDAGRYEGNSERAWNERIAI